MFFNKFFHKFSLSFGIAMMMVLSLFLLLPFTTYAQEPIVSQGFEDGDTWIYSSNPVTYNVSGDVWDVVGSLSTITPASGNNFWGMQDLNNGNGGGAFYHTLDFEPIDISGYSNVELSFKYYTIGFDETNSDIISYSVKYDAGTDWISATTLMSDTSSAWITVTIPISDDKSYVRLRLAAIQNGGSDYGAWDDITLTRDAPSLSFSKTASPDTNVTYHGEITYTITLTNSGSLSATNTLITDTLPTEVNFIRWIEQSAAMETSDEITWTGTVTNNEAITISFVVSHTGDYDEIITNTAEYSHSSMTSVATATATFYVASDTPNLSILKTVYPNEDVHPSGEVTYTITVDNSGGADANNTVISDALPIDTAWVRWGNQSGANINNDVITWTGTVAALQNVSFSFVVSHSYDYGSIVTNTATYSHASVTNSSAVSFTVITPTMLINEVDADTYGDETEEFIELYDGGVGNISLSDKILVLFNGNDDSIYGYFAFGSHATDEDGYFVIGGHDVMNAHLTITDTSWLQNGVDAIALFNGESDGFPIGMTVTATLSLSTPLDAIVYAKINNPVDDGLISLINDGQSIVNENEQGNDTYYSNQRFPNGSGGARNTDTYTQTFPTPGFANCIPVPHFDMDKTASPNADVAYHGEVTYTITLENDGTSSASGVVITDALPSNVTFARWIEQDSATENSGQISWTGDIINGESIMLSFVVTHDGDYSDMVENTAYYKYNDYIGSDSATFEVMSAIEFSKQVYPEINVAYQGDITYTISISNLSASTISDIMMTDTLPTSVTFDAWLNQHGAEVTYGVITWSGSVTAESTIMFSFIANQTADYGDTVMNTADYDSPVGMGSDSASFNVQYEPIEAPLVINEVDADTPGTETEEFVELYDGGVGNTPLDGLVIVTFNGSDNQSYSDSYDLDGYTTDENGYFVLCGADVLSESSSVKIVPDTYWVQNGADAVALYQGDAIDFPNDTQITLANLIDAIVYDTNDDDNEELLVLLNAGQPQVDERGAGDGEAHSNQRCPDGAGGQRNTDTYIQNAPSPKAENNCPVNLAIEKTAPAIILPGHVMTYTITVSNAIAVPAEDVAIDDTLPDGVSYLSDDSGFDCTACVAGATGELDWTVGTFTETNMSFNLVVSVSDTILVGSIITNMVEITSSTVDSDLTNNQATWQTSVTDLDLTVSKSVPPIILGEDTYAYTIIVQTYGKTLATNVMMTDTLPSVTFIAESNDGGFTANESAGVITWDLSDIPAETKYTFMVTVTVDNVTTPTLLSNQVTVSTDNINDPTGNNTAIAETIVYPYASIYDIQFVSDPDTDDASTYADQTVGTEGIVTADFGSNIFIQDGDGAWNGIMLYGSNIGDMLEVGDHVQVIGEVIEYNGLTEIASPDVVVISSGNALPSFEILETGDVADEQYEGVLVRTENVTVTNPDLGYGEWEIDDGSGAVVVDDNDSYTYSPAQDDTLAYVQGPLNYSYSNFKIKPRHDDDIRQTGVMNFDKEAPSTVEPGDVFTYTLTLENSLGYTLTNVVITDTVPNSLTVASVLDNGSSNDGLITWNIGDVADQETVMVQFVVTAPITSGIIIRNDDYAFTSDSDTVMGEAVNTIVGTITIHDIQYTEDSSGDSPFKDQVVTTEGIVTADFGDNIFIQDGAGAWNGIMLYKPSGTFSVGDHVQVMGEIIEYYGMTEFASGNEVTVISSDNSLPPYETVTTANANAEQYESVLVRVENVTVTDPDLGNGEWYVDDGSGEVMVDDLGNFSYMPQLNDSLMHVQGPLNYGYNNFKIEPRDDGDIGFVSLSKTAPGNIGAGEIFTYTLIIHNNTNLVLSNLVLTDTIPMSVTLVGHGTANLTGGVLQWDIASLAPHATAIVEFSVMAPDEEGLLIVNDDYALNADNYPMSVFGNVANTIVGQATIPLIQGEGLASQFIGQNVTLEGVVVGDFQDGMSGFFIQDPIGDGNLLTSDGIFVYDYNNAYPVDNGDYVSVSGTVSEYNDGTQLGNISAVEIVSTGNVISPTIVTLPESVNGELEMYEGMLVKLDHDMTVVQNYFLGKYGQLTLAEGGRLFKATNVYTPSSQQAIDLTDENQRRSLVLDDGSSHQAPDPIPYIGENNTVRAGDKVSELIGVLDEGLINSGSNVDYRLHPTQAPTFERVNERTATPEHVDGSIKVASFNVLNYFTTFGSRGADNAEEFSRQRVKIIAAMGSINADVYGLMEIENNGYDTDSAIYDLVSGMNEYITHTTYAFVDPGMSQVGGDQITVGFIYNTETITVVGSAVTSNTGAFAQKNRQPLVQTFAEKATDEKFTVVVNHFKSKGSSCDDMGDPDMGDGQGNCNGVRTQASEELVAWLATDPTASGNDKFLIIGDLNAYAFEDPIRAIEAHGYGNLIKMFQKHLAYSYVFDGESGYLDHALASPSMTPQVMGATEWHINADEPSVIDYNQEVPDTGTPKPEDLYTPDAYRASDHDPVIVGLNLTFVPTDVAPSEVIISGNATGKINVAYAFTATVSPLTTTLPITYHWSATDMPDVTHQQNHATFIWTEDGVKQITVKAQNGVGMVSATHVITILHRHVISSNGQTIVFTNTDDTGVTIEVPSGAVSETIELVYTSLETPSQPLTNSLTFAGQAFQLDAYLNDILQAGYTFNKPVIITVKYTDDNIQGLITDTLRIFKYKDDNWHDVAQISTDTCTPTSYDRSVANQLSIGICGLSEFILAGEEMESEQPPKIYLPIVLKN